MGTINFYQLNPLFVIYLGIILGLAAFILIGQHIFLAVPTGKRRITRLLIWLVFLTGCLLILIGRYNWSPDIYSYSIRGYISSAYMLVITLPTLYYSLKIFLPRSNIPFFVLGVVTLILILPYQWLGIDQWYYHLNRPAFWIPDTWPKRESIGQSLANLRFMPFEVVYFLGATLFGFGLAFIRVQRLKASNGLKYAIHLAAPWLGLFLLIILQTWLHLSTRSPYNYVASLLAEDFFGVKYVFPEEQGAVNIDYDVFRDLEEHFIGIPKVTNTMLIRRSYLFYLSSQASFFLPPYYVFLTINIGLWFVACLCAYHLAKLLWNHQVGIYFTFLVGCGPGFIMYVAQPMSYLAGYAIIIILLYLFERMIVRNPNVTINIYVLFGGILGLAMMVYDIFPLCVFFFIYAYFKGISALKFFVSFVLAIGIYFGFLLLQSQGLKLEFEGSNVQYLSIALNNIRQLLTEPDFGKLYLLTVTFVGVYFGSLGNAFFVMPLLLAIFGIAWVRDYDQPMVILLWALPSLITLGILHYGQAVWHNVPLATQPRFVYIAYPFVYLLAAIFLVQIRLLFTNKGWAGAKAVPWVILAGIFVLNNIDVFGYHQLYYLFYHPIVWEQFP